MFRASPPISEQVYEPDHPNVAIDVHNLGLVLLDLGDFKEARKCFERALKIDEQVYGPDHPNTKIVADNLNSFSLKAELISIAYLCHNMVTLRH